MARPSRRSKFGIAEPEIPMEQQKSPPELLARSSSTSSTSNNDIMEPDNGVVYEDQEDDDEDFVRSSFPKEQGRGQRGHPPGGPQKPDYSKMTAKMAAFAQKEHRAIQKAWTDAQHRDRLKKNNTNVPPMEYLGDVTENL